VEVLEKQESSMQKQNKTKCREMFKIEDNTLVKAQSLKRLGSFQG
jgi:hypothetical protein